MNKLPLGQWLLTVDEEGELTIQSRGEAPLALKKETVDWDTPGIYEVTITAIDKDGNQVSAKARITILPRDTGSFPNTNSDPDNTPDTGDGNDVISWAD